VLARRRSVVTPKLRNDACSAGMLTASKDSHHEHIGDAELKGSPMDTTTGTATITGHS
jgi:hypothetical protein